MNPIEIDMLQGDQGPARTFNFVRQDGSIPDLTGCTVDFYTYHPTSRTQTNKDHESCTVVNPGTNGQAIYTWLAGDITDAGIYLCKLSINGLSSGSPESVIVTLNVTEDPGID